MNLNIDYKRNEIDVAETTNKELSSNYIQYSVNSNPKYKDGLDGQKRRMWGRIQRKLDDCVNLDIDTIELDVSEIDFIKDTFNSAKFPAGTSKYVVILEEVINSLGK